VIEALAAGIPYVASDIPPIREATKGGVGGMLFKPLDTEELTRELDETLEGRVATGGAGASRLLEEYDWKNLAMAYESEAQRVVQGMDRSDEPCPRWEPPPPGPGPDRVIGR
jgi:glycosyltransferase involved in cell wall biosynthesis